MNHSSVGGIGLWLLTTFGIWGMVVPAVIWGLPFIFLRDQKAKDLTGEGLLLQPWRVQAGNNSGLFTPDQTRTST